MKKLIIILLFVAYNLSGQLVFDIDSNIRTRFNIDDSVIIFTWNDTLALPQRETDTIKVVMMVSDTSEMLYGYDYYGREIFDYNYAVRWKFDYEVLEKHNTSEGVFDAGFYEDNYWHDYCLHIKYLDIDKKELSKSVIVWQAVKTK